jgi:2-keto-4-pentenoate hydratase/2-oxohepta-3-ene-1,7-dioic acid hydratase in catechol pathway
MIAMSVSSVASGAAAGAATHFVRFRKGPVSAHGIVDGDSIREIQGDLFGAFKESGRKHKLADVKLLYPCQPPKVFAVGLNYRSHLGNRPAPARPEIFYKPITALQNPDDPIAQGMSHPSRRGK